jgi:hypothetical protein
MGKRHDGIGIKQVIRLEWMQKATNLLLAGLDSKSIRQDLHEFLAGQYRTGIEEERSDLTRTFAVNNLMRIWVAPDQELVVFRDASLSFLRENPSMGLAIHWGMISAAYPFWFNVARQVGRLLALQDQFTQTQIVNRLKEQYGDRQTVSRYARFVIRSFVAWEVLRDSTEMGCYEKDAPMKLGDSDLAILLLESVLHATPDAKAPLSLLQSNPALFPFHLHPITGDFISQRCPHIEALRYGSDEWVLKLVKRHNSR